MDIKPIQKLNIYAGEAVKSTLNNSPFAKENLRQFFAHANEHNIQSPALISYFTEWNYYKDHPEMLTKAAKTRVFGLDKIISEYAKNTPELGKECDKFISEINRKYPKTGQARAALACEGEVVSDKVKKSSKWHKAVVRFNLFLEKLMSEE